LLNQTKINDQQNKLTLAFVNENLEQAFQIDHARQTLTQVRVALIIATFFYAIFSIIDFIIVSEGHWGPLLVRFAFAVPAFILAYIATYRPFFRKRLQKLVSVVIVIAGLGIAIITLLYENTRSDLYLAGTLLPVFWAFIYSGLRFSNAVKVVVILFLIFNIMFVFFSDFSNATIIVYNFFLVTSIVIGMLGGYTIERYYRRDYIGQKKLKSEKRENEKLLLNILPAHIALELKQHSGTIAKDYEHITVLFTDLVGFTQLSNNHTAKEVVKLLNDIFCQFDALTDELNLEKIKTIGDAYMVTSRLQNPSSDSVVQVAKFSLEINHILETYNAKHNHQLKLRTGIHTGDAVAGVIGVKKFVYDVWGNTVNIASRMESTCPVGKVQVSKECYEILCSHYNFEPRGEIEIKGYKKMQTFLLLSEKDQIDQSSKSAS